MLPKQFDTSQAPHIQDRSGTWVLNQAAKDIQRLMFNQKYSIQVVTPDGQFVAAEFTSAYDPMFSSVQIIRQDLGELLADVKDEQIAFKIYQTSQMAQQIAAMSERFLLLGSVSGNIQLQFAGITRQQMRDSMPYPTPYYAQQYARYKAELELVYAKYVYLSAQAGMMSKDLGDFKVTRQILIPQIKEVLEDLKRNLKEWEDQLRGGMIGKPRRTTRGKSHEFKPLRGGPLGGGGT